MVQNPSFLMVPVFPTFFVFAFNATGQTSDTIAPVNEPPPYVPENTSEACRDGIDNDEDGFADCDDDGCSLLTFCVENLPENTSKACQDKLDNDGDGAGIGMAY